MWVSPCILPYIPTNPTTFPNHNPQSLRRLTAHTKQQRMSSFSLHQRYTSELVPELGIGTVTETAKGRFKLEWNLQRTLAKINYRIHTDAIKEALIPAAVTKVQANLTYASEADLLNVALFGQTAKQWRDAHPDADGKLRDHILLAQLVVLTNLESLNAMLIRQGLPAPERLLKLNEIAITQMRTLLADTNLKNLQ